MLYPEITRLFKDTDICCRTWKIHKFSIKTCVYFSPYFRRLRPSFRKLDLTLCRASAPDRIFRKESPNSDFGKEKDTKLSRVLCDHKACLIFLFKKSARAFIYVLQGRLSSLKAKLLSKYPLLYKIPSSTPSKFSSPCQKGNFPSLFGRTA